MGNETRRGRLRALIRNSSLKAGEGALPGYHKPSKRMHRGFLYLDDETVINSLSAMEAGKIDEVVAKVNLAREGGLGGTVGAQGVSLEGSRRQASALEEEMVRKRTRFSVFEIWYQKLVESKAIGSFSGWGDSALNGVQPGDTIELRGVLEAAPLQTLLRLFLWFADKAKSQGHVFSQSGDALKETKRAETTIRMIIGGPEEDGNEQVIVLAVPHGDPGPTVAMPVKTRWLIGNLGQLGGEYTVVAQVERIIGPDEELPALRLTHDVAATPLEITTLKEVLSGFVEPAKELGVVITDNEATIKGPALWLEPIAIYR